MPAKNRTWSITRIVNTVGNHLREQRERAVSEDQDACRYLAPDGKRCAVGCLIPKRLYDSDIEGLGISALIHGVSSGDYAFRQRTEKLRKILADAGLFVGDKDQDRIRQQLLQRMQDLHDGLPDGKVPVRVIDEKIQQALDYMHDEYPDFPELEWV